MMEWMFNNPIRSDQAENCFASLGAQLGDAYLPSSDCLGKFKETFNIKGEAIF